MNLKFLLLIVTLLGLFVSSYGLGCESCNVSKQDKTMFNCKNCGLNKNGPVNCEECDTKKDNTAVCYNCQNVG